jgi:hypothetical protein
MQIAQARFEIERELQARNGSMVTQIDCEFADAGVAMAYVYFDHGEPLDLLIDLPRPTTEATFDRRALAQALCPSTAPPVLH